MQNFFFNLNTFANKNKLLFSGIVFALLLFFGFCASRISFQENITQLIPSNDQSGVTSKVLEQVNFADKITIIIKSKNNGSPDDLTQYANEFISELDSKCKPYVGKIQGKIDEENIQETFDFVYAHLPLFLDKNDYATIQNKINNDSISKIVEADYKSLVSPTGMVTKDFILQDPLGISFMALKKLQQLSIGDDFELQNGFVLTKDKKNLMLFITTKLPANETDKNTLFIAELDKIKTGLSTKFGNKVSMSYFGATPVAVANATQIKSDVQKTSIFATVTLILILAFFYRNISTPILIFIPSVFGAIFALAVLYFFKGTISAISLGISSILLGETTDYSIYVLTHLRNKKDVKLLYKDISKPLMLCGITTGITFLCLFFIKSEALQDLAIFAALSVVATSFFSLVLIPLLYKSKNEIVVPKLNIIDKLGSYSYHKNKFLIVSVFVLLIISLFTYSKVTFNNDLSSLNFMTPELKKTEKYLENIANISSKSIYLVTHGKNYEEVLKNNNKLFSVLEKDKKAAKILNFSSIGGIVFSEEIQKQKIQDWNAFWDSEKKTNLKNNLISNGNKYGFKDSTFSVFYETLNQNFNAISFQEYAKVKSFFLEEFVVNKNDFYTISTLVKVPNDKRDSFVNDIKKQPNTVVIDRQETNEVFLNSLKANFENLENYSFMIIFLVLFIAFRRLELAIVSIIPILISWIFTTGIMGMFGIQFNVINIIVCTLIFGIGVDYSIFMTMALQKEHTFGKEELPTYKTSILLSVATTILGIGVLIFAKHPALKSIALIGIIGIFSSLIITFVIQPLVFAFFVTNRTKKGKQPFELRSFIHGILSFIYYGFGGFLMSIFSVTILKILPFKTETKMKYYRKVMSKFMKSVLYTNPFVVKKIINNGNEKFDKPAVIIANHTSFLDILSVGLLSPKIIYLVSDWVYNSPVFGGAVKASGFYPVSEGVDGSLEHLRPKIEEGYSIMVFPEGTRSESNVIKRFHKGAFYIAEHFNLDIIPILIHGNSEALPKNDFIIYDGSITIKILERITPDNNAFGNDYAERTKKIGAFFKQEFQKIRYEIEDENYFKKIILLSFAYKETEIVNAVKADLKNNLLCYFNLNKYIGTKAKVLHLANDFGQLNVLLTLQEAQRKVDSYLVNDLNRDIAKQNLWTKKRDINYLTSEDEIEQNYDVVLISEATNNINIQKIADIASSVLLINNFKSLNSFLDFGFEIELQDDQLILLKKKW
ncbi:1-acyl-sn-glycerol-3-phosphate acyltransferases [Flavobacterium swingsii]|uniref:1-acyl-sn-glycerol-3-phosphate acyltransferases n=1 Tax=Flavobacterium swingsii TaxID=498292 RepID=A0A1I0XLW5_9FLAO|nr:1-acyl-sn-glycerol-3-phosphate acyltransferase [Flavobacterium swingsii]SFB01894.1 1-acyl-sn-glycerol-3-phosphate acyltransferases [Flavobacterium swingsii]